MAKKTTTQKLYAAIRQEFAQLSAVQEFGVKKYNQKYIIAKLSNDFYKEPSTIEKIVFYNA